MIAGDVRPGWVLAATWVTGELDGNFSTMMTSCCICSVNISGVCRRRYCSGPRDGQCDAGKRGGEKEPRYGVADGERKKKTSEAAAVGVSEEKTEGEGGKRRTERKLGSLSRISSKKQLSSTGKKRVRCKFVQKGQEIPFEIAMQENYKWKESQRGRASSIFLN